MPYLLGYLEAPDYAGGPLAWDIKAASTEVVVAADDPTTLHVPDGWWAITTTSSPPGPPVPLVIGGQFIRTLLGGGVVPIYGGVLRVALADESADRHGSYVGVAIAARWVDDLEDDTAALCAD